MICDLCKGATPPVGARCRKCGNSTPLPAGHRCHADGCATLVKPEMLMCLKHWRMVPKRIQRLVWKFYRPGQCNDYDLIDPDWHLAADAAIGAVARLELRPLQKQWIVALATLENEGLL